MAKEEAIIYLADARKCIQNSESRSQNSEYRSYQSLKESFLDLTAVNDETLAAGITISRNGTILIIPLVGDIVTDQRISPGQVQIINNPSITNPFKDELVNYILIGFNRNLSKEIIDFDLANNCLQQLTTNNFFIGKFDGRFDGIHKLPDKTKGIFAFVIEGVFEVQNRLLHARDGLALTNVTEVEFEALSNEALLLLIEVY